jgi:phosphoribosylaminoimidazolecarboxamide formyltransferase/IMP cyclohydrolase
MYACPGRLCREQTGLAGLRLSKNGTLYLESEEGEEGMELLPVRRALVSVTNKSGLAELAAALAGGGAEMVSTGGTARTLEAAGLPVTAVSVVTGFPEMLGGRVKTLHPCIHGAILADKDNAGHMAALAELGIQPFDLVCVNLYDFASAVTGQASPAQAVEEIDIGGPCLLRAAAKNFSSVLVLPEPAAYPDFLAEYARLGAVSLALRRRMAARAFALTSAYDAMIARFFQAAG